MKDGVGYGTAQKAIAVGTSSGPFLGPNPDRIGLILSCPPVNRITISLDNPAVSGVGLVLNPGQNPLLLSAKFQGDIVNKPLFAIADTAPQTVGVFEVIAPRINDPKLYDSYPMGAT